MILSRLSKQEVKVEVKVKKHRRYRHMKDLEDEEVLKVEQDLRLAADLFALILWILIAAAWRYFFDSLLVGIGIGFVIALVISIYFGKKR